MSDVSLRTDETVVNALKTYGNTILRLSYSYLHNLSDAEDIVQDTLLSLINNEPVFSSPEHEKAWLMRVTINLCRPVQFFALYMAERLFYDLYHEFCVFWVEIVGRVFQIPQKPFAALFQFAARDLPALGNAPRILHDEGIVFMLFHRRFSSASASLDLPPFTFHFVVDFLQAGRGQAKLGRIGEHDAAELLNNQIVRIFHDILRTGLVGVLHHELGAELFERFAGGIVVHHSPRVSVDGICKAVFIGSDGPHVLNDFFLVFVQSLHRIHLA